MDRVFFHTKWGKYVNFIFFKNIFFTSGNFTLN